MLQIVLKVTSGPHEGREFSFDGHDNFIVGRAKSAQFRLSTKDQYFSRNHFLVEVNPPLCRLLDLNSLNGTFVNGQKVTSVELHDGDTIKGGDTTLQVSLVLAAVAKVSMPSRSPESNAVAKPRSAPQQVGDQTIVPRDWYRNDPIAALSPSLVDRGTSGVSGQKEPVAAVAVPAHALNPHLIGQPSVHPASGISAEDRVKIAGQPQPFDGYEIIEEIGRGAMGVVYRARDRKDGGVVALKVVLPAVASSPEDLARFVREASIVKELTHPHIVPFRDLGHAGGQLYFVMKLVPGIDGQSFLRQHEGPLPVVRAVNIVCQLLEALSAAHQAGYVHRDVKPSNLLIEPRPTGDFVWLADFGLAREYQASMLSGLTTTGNIGGTLPYMAPEQITNYRDVTPAADQYSAAATLYHLLTRSYPYDFPSDMARRLLMILQESPLPIQTRRLDIPEQLSAVVHKGLARQPGDRFADVAAFSTALRLSVK